MELFLTTLYAVEKFKSTSEISTSQLHSIAELEKVFQCNCSML